jgi:hypothetical protein
MRWTKWSRSTGITGRDQPVRARSELGAARIGGGKVFHEWVSLERLTLDYTERIDVFE